MQLIPHWNAGLPGVATRADIILSQVIATRADIILSQATAVGANKKILVPHMNAD